MLVVVLTTCCGDTHTDNCEPLIIIDRDNKKYLLFIFQVIDLNQCKLVTHVFQLEQDGPGQEELGDEDMAAANHWVLPSVEFDGLWNSLVFDSNVKAEVKSLNNFHLFDVKV